MLGTVHKFDKQKGFGFITPDNSKEDVFVHFSGIKETGYKTLTEGQRVSFVEIKGKRGMQAVDVEVIPE